MTDLLSCPFCGSTAIDPEGWVSVNKDGTQEKSGPACDECGGSTESVERWNSRTIETVRLQNVSRYVEKYRFEFEDGRQYTPNEQDKALLEDALEGYLAVSSTMNRESVARTLYEIQPLEDRLGGYGQPISWETLASFCKELHYNQADAIIALEPAGIAQAPTR